MTRAEFIKIMERCQNGDKKALGILYEEYFGQLFVTAYQILRDTDAAYDVATNVVLALLEFKKDVTTIDNHVGYMITMVQNKAKDYIKWRKREISVSEIQKLSGREVVYDTLWLDDIYRVLTESEKELFRLYYVWDFSLKEAASKLGITYAAVKTRNVKLKEKIRAVYKKGRK